MYSADRAHQVDSTVLGMRSSLWEASILIQNPLMLFLGTDYRTLGTLKNAETQHPRNIHIPGFRTVKHRSWSWTPCNFLPSLIHANHVSKSPILFCHQKLGNVYSPLIAHDWHPAWSTSWFILLQPLRDRRYPRHVILRPLIWGNERQWEALPTGIMQPTWFN